MSVLEDFYDGKLSPSERFYKKGTEFQKRTQQLSEKKLMFCQMDSTVKSESCSKKLKMKFVSFIHKQKEMFLKQAFLWELKWLWKLNILRAKYMNNQLQVILCTTQKEPQTHSCEFAALFIFKLIDQSLRKSCRFRAYQAEPFERLYKPFLC